MDEVSRQDSAMTDARHAQKDITAIKGKLAALQSPASGTISHLETKLADVHARVEELQAKHAASLARTAALKAKLKGGGVGDEPRDDHGRWTK